MRGEEHLYFRDEFFGAPGEDQTGAFDVYLAGRTFYLEAGFIDIVDEDLVGFTDGFIFL